MKDFDAELRRIQRERAEEAARVTQGHTIAEMRVLPTSALNIYRKALEKIAAIPISADTCRDHTMREIAINALARDLEN